MARATVVPRANNATIGTIATIATFVNVASTDSNAT
jgi:hypothetical protein